MLRLLADESLRGPVVRGLRRRQPELDVVRAQDVGLYGASDPDILEWAAADNRVIVTQDARTFSFHAFRRVDAGLPMPGVLKVAQSLPIGQAIEEILTVVECSREGELDGQVLHLPLR